MDKDMKETEMTVENLTHRIRETVEKYISQEECYGDDTRRTTFRNATTIR